MKNSVYFKIIVAYLAFSTVIVLGINYIIQPIIRDSLIEQTGKDVYRQAYSLSQRYGKYHYDLANDEYNFVNDITTLAYSTDTIIWLAADDGTILACSTDYFISKRLDNIGDYFLDKYYSVGSFKGIFNSEYISAAAPIVNNFKTYGYVVINKDIGDVELSTINIMNMIYLITIGILILTIILLIVFILSYYLPLKKITKASKELAKGNFDYDGLKNVKSRDEIGVLATNLNFMATEFKSIDDKQRKFIANCSHDFRSPLTSIKGYLEAMLDGTIPPEKYDKYMNIVLSEAERLNRLTSSLLTLNTWNSASQALDLSDFDIVSCVRNTISSFEGQCNKKKITMDVTFGAKIFIVTADQLKIQQVLYNLIDNAIKFSHTNSTIFVSVMDKNEKIFVSIKDSGIGIPKESLSKIWDRFYKTDSSRGKDKSGSGLGLAIAKEVITSHNENINVISTEGVGTEFIFTLHKSKNSSRIF